MCRLAHQHNPDPVNLSVHSIKKRSDADPNVDDNTFPTLYIAVVYGEVASIYICY